MHLVVAVDLLVVVVVDVWLCSSCCTRRKDIGSFANHTVVLFCSFVICILRKIFPHCLDSAFLLVGMEDFVVALLQIGQPC